MEPTRALPPPLPLPLPRAFPGFLQALGLFALYFAMQIVSLIPGAVVDAVRKSKDFTLHPGLIGLAAVLSAVVVVAVAKGRTGRGVDQLFAWIPIRSGVLLWAAALIFAHLIFGLLCMVWIERGFPNAIPKVDYGFSKSRWFAAILIVAIAPLTEEAIFRGIFLRGFAARYGLVRGLSLSALFFAVAHGSPARVLFTFGLGCILGWLYLRTGSLWTSVAAHAMNNAIAAIAILLATPQPKSKLPAFHPAEMVGAVAAIALVAMAIQKLRTIFAAADPPEAEQVFLD